MTDPVTTKRGSVSVIGSSDHCSRSLGPPALAAKNILSRFYLASSLTTETVVKPWSASRGVCPVGRDGECSSHGDTLHCSGRRRQNTRLLPAWDAAAVGDGTADL